MTDLNVLHAMSVIPDTSFIVTILAQENALAQVLQLGADVVVGMACLSVGTFLLILLIPRRDFPFSRFLWPLSICAISSGLLHILNGATPWWSSEMFVISAKVSMALVVLGTGLVLVQSLFKVLNAISQPQLEELVQRQVDELALLSHQVQEQADQGASIAHELIQKDSHLRLALHAGRMGTWEWNLDTNISVMDAFELELTGLSSETGEVRAEQFFERVHPEDRPALEQSIQDAIKFRREFDAEFRLVHPDGSVRWICGRGEVEVDSSGRPICMRGVNFETTQARYADEQLARNEAYLRSLLDSSADCIKVLSPEGRILSVNRSGLSALDVTEATLIEGRDWLSFWEMEDVEVARKALDAARSGNVGRFQGVCPATNGTFKRWDVIVTSIGDTTGEAQRLMCISRDITEMHDLSKARQETEDRFRMLADNIAQFAWMTNEAGEMLWYNQRWFDYTGATFDQVKGWNWENLHHPQHRERVMSRFRQAIQAGTDWEDTFPLLGKDGKYRWFLSQARAIRNENGAVVKWFGTNTDITERLAADQALTRTHAQLKSIVDAAADAIITVDSKGQILSANSAVKPIFGYLPKELLGLHIEDLIPPADNRHLDASNGNQLQRIGFLIGKGRECHGRRKDGTVAILETSFSESQVGSKRFLGGILRDITDRKRTEEVLRIRTRAIESATNGIVISDAQSTTNAIIYVNPAFEQLTGYAAEEVIGKDHQFLEGPETDPSLSAVVQRAIKNHEECHVTILHYRKDGSRFWNDLHISPVEDDFGHVTHFIGIQSDVTNRIRYEHRLREAQEQANSANRSKSQFLANMSHEIRTPLTAILGCADTLFRKMKDPDPKAVVRMIRDQGYLLMAILNDVLDLSKIEAGKLEIRVESCDLVSILGEVYNLMQSQASEKGIALRIVYQTRIPEQIRTDPVRLRQILLNFVSNAIKFTSSGHVEIQVACLNDPDQARLKITVEDTGIGIASDRLQSIFEAFAQERNPLTSRIPGTGLGLTICQKLVQMLGGTIDVTSEERKGSRFTVDLPLGKLEPAALEDPASVSRKSALRDSKLFDDTIIPCRVLIAEDTRGIQFMMTRMLQDVVAGIKVVENGELAVNEVIQASETGHPYDIVLMDMQMHVMDGFQATKKLRELGYTLPVIALTASAMAGDRERCLAAGCTDYLAKPIDRKELINKLQLLCDI